MDELSGRVQGYNFALKGLNARLQNEESMAPHEVERLVTELVDLSLDRADLAVYLDLLPPDQLAQVGELSDFRTTIVLASRHLARLRSAIDDRDDELHARVDQLSRRLADIAISDGARR